MSVAECYCTSHTHDTVPAMQSLCSVLVAAVLASLPEAEPWPDIVRATTLLAPGDGNQ
ncbi:hypothetical protein LuPra_02459 [Luteitalea pratensis]|uniref:Uncharacterized protein n=1 Tax=Luteitalea pratensis TaxID=1855912 RepID=A0A143PLF9_LUTPR|nr:hypothetical protein LuPra_02459 [Luteitalea pratensis]